MNASPTIAVDESLIHDHINRAIAAVFVTMLNRTPVPAAPLFRSILPAPLSDLAASVGFVGEVNGVIYLRFSLGFARFCTCHLLGMSERELDEAGEDVVNDAIGEMANMTAGSFKNGLCDAGFPSKLTLPTIVRGTALAIKSPSSTTRYCYSFDIDEHNMLVDVLMKSET